MSRLSRWLAPSTVVRAHCDLPCGVYDPEQARIEAESCYKIIEKYAANEDATFRTRAIAIKEKQADLVKLAFEKALSNARELAELVAKSNSEAAEVINKRVSESLEEVKAVVTKAKVK